MRESISEKQSKDLAEKRAAREAKQPYATELEDRQFDKSQDHKSPDQKPSGQGEKKHHSHRRSSSE